MEPGLEPRPPDPQHGPFSHLLPPPPGLIVAVTERRQESGRVWPAPCQALAWLREPPGAVLQPISVPGDYRAVGLTVARTLSPGACRGWMPDLTVGSGGSTDTGKEASACLCDDPPRLSLFL